MQPNDRKKQMLVAVAGTAVALVVMGSFFWTFFKDFLHAQPGRARGSNVPLLIFGGFFIVMAASVVFSVVRGVRKISRADLPPGPQDPKPWLARADWAVGKIKSSATAPTKFLLLWSVLALALSAPAVWKIPQEWQKGNRLILLALIFPVVAVALLGFSLAKWRSRRRFGDCHFELASIPGALGGTLEGLIQTGSRLNLEHGLHLKLSCVRVTVSGSGEDQSRQESILWQDEKIFNANASLPEPEPGRTGIPVFFKLPANQPECGNGVFWRLDATAKLSGPDFSATFDVPVFRVAGVAVAADEPDPTAALQMPVEELRRDENSKIQVTDGPHGREFYFPAARNLGMAFGLTLFLAIWSGFLWLMMVKHAPVLFPIVFGLFEILLVWGFVSAWFKSSRVTVNSSGVTRQNRWLIVSRTRRFDAGEIVRFDTKIGMTSGNQAFQDLKLVTRAGEDNMEARKARYEQTGERPPLKFRVNDSGGVTLASSIASKPEADWLVQEMTRALGRKR